ncbi:hypothetical protein PHLCEN_2v10434 [Hermanssonia centrifuga]|uniref:Reverse transcriptase n=2 Tax=Hermanssonia centrifuga TaxID=98765 RepID=A0A2R6NMY5_9APHY|nr:hypothetical protein PHLCEN_2v10434 [Hermanssonia centrifuga]
MLDPDKYELALIQEPYIDWLGLTRANPKWSVIYPTGHRDKASKDKMRSVILVNKRISTNDWDEVDCDSTDVTVIRLRTPSGPLYIFNIYNDQTHDRTIGKLIGKMVAIEREETERGIGEGANRTSQIAHIIWAGDFNRHHSFWERAENTHLLSRSYLDAAEPLVTALATFDLIQVLPPEIPTLQANATGNLTRPDNVFASPGLAERLISCDAHPALRPPNTDHFPIHSNFDVSLTAAQEIPGWNWRKVEEAEFYLALDEAVESRHIRKRRIKTREEFDQVLEQLTDALVEAREKTVPKRKPSPFAKRWWTADLAKTRFRVKRLARDSYRKRKEPHNLIHVEYKKARNEYGERIRKAKKEHWEAFLEDVDGESIWNFSSYAASEHTDGGRTRIPQLRSTGTHGRTKLSKSNDEKSKALHEAFFPHPGNPPSNQDTAAYPEPAFEFKGITKDIIREVIKNLKRYKAPGIDDFPNEVFIWCEDLLTPILFLLFQASYELGIYPDFWKISRTLVLRKPQRKDYSLPNAYRPIALLICIAKILSACMAKILAIQTERLGLLSNNHFLGRMGRTTTDSLHYITATVKNAWRTHKVASILFLDVQAAFPSVNPERLLHILRLKGIPKEIVDWLRLKMTSRRTVLCFDDFKSSQFEIKGGLEQGCPLSVILYQFYNSELLEGANRKNGEIATGNIDDVAVVAIANNFDDTHEILRSFMTRRGGAFQWAEEHNSTFSVGKFGLLNCSRVLGDLGPTLKLGQTTIKPAKTHKFLGILLDNKLKWQAQTERARDKGLQWLTHFRRMANVKHGISLRISQRLYFMIAIPSMLYAADVFLTPIRAGTHPSNKRTGSVSAITRLSSVHRQAAMMMTGAMRTTATDVMEIHANILPFPLLIDKLCHRAFARLCTLPETHPLQPLVNRAAKHYPRRHRSAIQELAHLFNLAPGAIETITPARYSPYWKPGHATEIAENKDQARESENRWARKDGIRVYTDGSDVDGGVGAAAVLYKPGRRQVKTLQYHLGPSTEHTVYEAEVVALILGMELIRQESSVRNVSLAVDNQAAVSASRSSRSAPGHYLMDKFHRLKARVKLKHRGAKITVRWVPGHMGIKGNEAADRRAKEAARDLMEIRRPIPTCLVKALPRSVSKIHQLHQQELVAEADRRWKSSPRWAKMNNIDPKLPSKRYGVLIAGLPRRHASILFQLRTGHAPLRKHLHKIGRADTPTCQACGEAPETVPHYILYCPAFNHPRAAMSFELGDDARSLTSLFTNAGSLRSLFRYIHRTRRFEEQFGGMSLPPAKEIREKAKKRGLKDTGKEKQKKRNEQR